MQEDILVFQFQMFFEDQIRTRSNYYRYISTSQKSSQDEYAPDECFYLIREN